MSKLKGLLKWWVRKPTVQLVTARSPGKTTTTAVNVVPLLTHFSLARQRVQAPKPHYFTPQPLLVAFDPDLTLPDPYWKERRALKQERKAKRPRNRR